MLVQDESMLYHVVELTAKRTDAEPGVYGYDAEARLCREIGPDVYVQANAFDGEKHYTVTDKSVIEYIAGDGDDPGANYTEEYTTLTGTKESAYWRVFETLNKVLNAMIGEI